jgi:hypothetical protein
MEAVAVTVAFLLVIVGLIWDQRAERRAWERDRAVLLDRIQAPVVFEARAAEAAEKGVVAYVGDESDTDGLTGAGGPDEEA